jgi:imidazolonepropionase-like amidohydrolase
LPITREIIMSFYRPLLLGLSLLCGLPAAAADSVLTVLRADQMLDVSTGELIAKPELHIVNGRIINVTSQGKKTQPITADTRLIELPGMTIMPGMIDMHTHITGVSSIQGYDSLAVSNSRAALYGVKNARTTLLAGFTSLRNLGASGYVDVSLRDAINDGDMPGPRLFVSGPSLGVTGGHCDDNMLPVDYNSVAEGVADGPWAVRQQVRENIKYGVDVIKFCATGGVMSKGTKVGVQQYTQEEMDALVNEAHMRGLKVAAHAHGTDGIKAAIRAGVDSVEHASFLDEEAIKLAKKYGTTLVMDIYVTEHILGEGEASGMLPESIEKERQTGGRQRDSFSRAVKAGVNMAFGTDASIYPHGDNARQLSRMQQFGMTPLQAVQATTVNAAILLGQQDNLGKLSAGLFADIIAVEGNPLEDLQRLENVSFVMKAGEVYKTP